MTSAMMEYLQFSKICVKLEELTPFARSAGGQRRKTNLVFGSQNVPRRPELHAKLHSAHLLSHLPARIPKQCNNSQRGRRGIRRASSSPPAPHPTAANGPPDLVCGEFLQPGRVSPLPPNRRLWKFRLKCGNNRVCHQLWNDLTSVLSCQRGRAAARLWGIM